MKKYYLLLLMFVSQVAFAQHKFITRWDLSKTGPVPNQIRFRVTTSGSVDYAWQEVAPGTASGAGAFNRPIGAWITGNVTNMAYMFYRADAFNQPIDTWQTGNSESLYSMFYGAAAFDQSLGNWTLKPSVNL